jgi:hypothetical protein
VSSVLRSDLYRPAAQGLGVSGSVAARGAPEIFVRQGPTSRDQRPFCWSDFEHGQNEYYARLSQRLHGSSNIAEYIGALQRGDAINVTWGEDDEVWDTDDGGWVADDDEALGQGGDGNGNSSGDGDDDDDSILDPYDDDDHDDDRDKSKGNSMDAESAAGSTFSGRSGEMAGEGAGGRQERALRGGEASGGSGRHRRRGKKPSIEYSHKGHPNCFDYDWAVVPPQDSPHVAAYH